MDNTLKIKHTLFMDKGNDSNKNNNTKPATDPRQILS